MNHSKLIIFISLLSASVFSGPNTAKKPQPEKEESSWTSTIVTLTLPVVVLVYGLKKIFFQSNAPRPELSREATKAGAERLSQIAPEVEPTQPAAPQAPVFFPGGSGMRYKTWGRPSLPENIAIADAAAASRVATLVSALVQEEADAKRHLEEQEQNLRFKLQQFENIILRLNIFAETLPEEGQVNELQQAILEAFAKLSNTQVPTRMIRATFQAALRTFQRKSTEKKLNSKKLQALKKALDNEVLNVLD